MLSKLQLDESCEPNSLEGSRVDGGASFICEDGNEGFKRAFVRMAVRASRGFIHSFIRRGVANGHSQKGRT